MDKHMTMITTHKAKKICKRTLQDDNETFIKKARTNESLKELKHDVAQEDRDLEESSTKNTTFNGEQDVLNGQSLRKFFTSSTGLNALRKFVTVCNENKEKDLAADYLLAGGNVLEVLRLLDSFDKKNSNNAISVFSAINILLMKILAEYPQYQSSAVEACRHLLNSYMSIVHSMLSIQSNTRQRKVVLKLLAAIVSLDSNLARELLVQLSLQQHVLENLVQHVKPTDPRNSRIYFIHFVLAFLVEGNTLVIRMLLDRYNLLSCIFPNLLYDSKDIVTLVLTTVKTYVLENTSISKTTKLHVFSTPVVLNLIALYNWKGPSNWPKNKTSNSSESKDFLADKEIINDVVHEFLITLLTSHRYGVIFHDLSLGSSQIKRNNLVYTVLQNLEKPWEHQKPSDLVIKIMKACPDIIRSQYGAIESFLEPRVSPKWICLLRFVKKIITSIDLTGCIKTCAVKLSANNLLSTLLSLTVPNIIVKSAILPGLNHESLSVRHEVLHLLLTMVQQLKAISLAMKEFYKSFTVQNQIIDFVLRTIPNLETILQMWNQAFEANTNTKALESTESVQNPELLDHLDVILDVLHSYKNICPELLDSLTNLQPNALLLNLDSLRKNQEEANIEKINYMKIKAIQFMLVLDSSIFSPRKKAFKEALLFLISLIRQKAFPECYNATKTLLNMTGLFETCTDQVDIWINGFSVATDPKEYEELIQWFISILKNAIKYSDKYIDSIIQAEGMINNQVDNFSVKKAKDMINELFNKANKISSCKNECPTIESSLVNGEFNIDTKKNNNIINGSFNKLDKENSKGIIKYTEKCTIQRKEQVINSNMRKVESVINRLLETNQSSFPHNGHPCNKVFSTSVSSLINRVANFNTKETEDVSLDSPVVKFGEENLNLYRTQTCVSVSPLLYCVFQKISEKDSAVILIYLSYVITHTLHHQVVPDLLVHMTTDLTNLPVYKYLQSWPNKNRPIALKCKLSSLKLLKKLSNLLLTDHKMNVTELSKLFDVGHSICCFQYDDKEVTIKHSLSLHDVKGLLRMIVFYLAQLAQRGILQPVQNENCRMLLVSLLNISQSMDQENIAVLEENARCIFTHSILLHYFSPFYGVSEDSTQSMEDMITQTILEVCEVVVHLYNKYDTRAHNVFFAFRNKFLIQFRNIIEKNPLETCSKNYDIAIALLKTLQLEAQDVASLLFSLMKLEKITFISNDKQNLSVFGYTVLILLEMYSSEESKSHRNQFDVLNDQFVEKLFLHLVYLKSNKINCVDKWEQALVKYLSIFPRDLASVSTNTFALLLTKDITTSTTQLIAVLIAQNTRLIPSLVKYLLKVENAKQGDVVFPILKSNLKYKWSERLLQSLYRCYGNDIAAYLTEPQNSIPWIEENVTAIAYLIENTFDLTLCEKTCDSIFQSGDKLDMVSICFVQLLESLYKRYESLITTKEKALTDLIKILLHVMTSTLKKESKNIEKINILCQKIDNAVICLKNTRRDFIFSSLSKSYSWPQFTRFSLKLGLKCTKDGEIHLSILQTLSNLCDIAYEDNIDDEYVKTLFEMTTSHSEFINVMLGSSTVKNDLVELLRILTRKNHSVMTVSHLPVYLAAYNATLSHVDQRILQILQYYEAHNVQLQQYWPYLWGNAAATRYSIKREIDTVLWRQPSTSEIFNLFDKDIVNETIRNFPIHRSLKNDQLHESNNVYDPAFYLPLLCSLLAENNIVACHKISQSGALALVIGACCSDLSNVRMAAYTIISRYYFHLEASKNKEKLLWMRLIDALRNGVISLKCSLKDARVSCLATTFLAKASLIATQPLHPLYSPLHTFLMAKPALDLYAIPELLQLLHSSHVEHRAHRYWILENIRDGMKEEDDVDVALRSMLFKMLLGFHGSILSDAQTKELILEVIASTTKIPKASLLLIRGYGVLPWLHEIVNNFDICETEVEIIVTIIENLLNSLHSLTEDVTHYRFLLFSILLRLKMYYNKRHTVCII